MKKEEILKVRTVKKFYDKKAGITREVGEVFEASAKRVNELLDYPYQVLVSLVIDDEESEAVEEPAEEKEEAVEEQEEMVEDPATVKMAKNK